MKFRLDPKRLGSILGQLRQKSSMSQAKISKICQVNSPQYISNIERGQCLPSLKILKIMLSEYNVNAEDKNRLISLFLEAAHAEIENIFNAETKAPTKIEPVPENPISSPPTEDRSSYCSMEGHLPSLSAARSG